jgi:uncharacterized protein
VSEALPSREQATQLLVANHCPTPVIHHCVGVTDFATKIAQKLQERGYPINLELVEAGAMLHDLGRAKSHTVAHSVIGAQLAQSLGLPESVVNIIKRHVGAGITADEADALGWPKDNYVPQTLEEKVVAYADKRVGHRDPMPIKVEIQRLQKENKPAAAERVRKLHEEIVAMLGETP